MRKLVECSTRREAGGQCSAAKPPLRPLLRLEARLPSPVTVAMRVRDRSVFARQFVVVFSGWTRAHRRWSSQEGMAISVRRILDGDETRLHDHRPSLHPQLALPPASCQPPTPSLPRIGVEGNRGCGGSLQQEVVPRTQSQPAPLSILDGRRPSICVQVSLTVERKKPSVRCVMLIRKASASCQRKIVAIGCASKTASTAGKTSANSGQQFFCSQLGGLKSFPRQEDCFFH